MNVYIATPIETASRPKDDLLSYAEKAAQILEAKGYTVHRPWKVHIPNAWDMSNKEWSKIVANDDISAINSSDLVVGIVYDRSEATAGTMFELGYAYAMQIPINIVVHESANKISLMVGSFADHVYFGLENFKNNIDNISVEMC